MLALLTAAAANAVDYDGPVDMDDNTGSGFYFLEPMKSSRPAAYFVRMNNYPCKVAISANQKILMWSPFHLDSDDVSNDTSYVKIEGGLYSGDFRIPDVAQIHNMKNNVLCGVVTSVSMGAFAKCHELTSVSLPVGLEEIRRGAFYDLYGSD